mmetsp:Transcript_45359/g.67351  ORF Transcript_45359/g.67351 Transcript_45359/m.67351 type:complete len:96 (+) Transcript_45359:219-506(+)
MCFRMRKAMWWTGYVQRGSCLTPSWFSAAVVDRIVFTCQSDASKQYHKAREIQRVDSRDSFYVMPNEGMSVVGRIMVLARQCDASNQLEARQNPN